MVMGDPPLSVRLLSNDIKQISAGDGSEQIVEDLKKSIEEGRPNISENPSSIIMTINMNGPAGGKGTAEKRRELLAMLLRCSFGIIFGQEVPGRFSAEVIPVGYGFVHNEKETAVIWDTQHFDGSCVGLRTTDTEIRELMRREQEKNPSASELLSRISMVRLKPKQNPKAADILAVSYHGPYKMKKEEKHSVCKTLLSFLDAVLKQKEISTYIIGGDFNFDTLDFELPNDVTRTFYEMSARLQEKQKKAHQFIPHKDNFFVFPKTVLTVSGSRPISLEDVNNLNSDQTKEDHKKGHEAINKEGTKAAEATYMLDHDPIVGFLTHSSPSRARRNLVEDFKNLSLSGSSE